MRKSPLSCHGQNRSANNSELAIDTEFNHFISSVRKPFVDFDDLMTSIGKTLEETSPVIIAIDIFNPDSLDKSVSTRESYFNTLINYYGNPLTETHGNETITADPIIDKIKKQKLK